MSPQETLSNSSIDTWVDDKSGAVALHLCQKLLPVEGEGQVIFPPTYADIGYNIDELSDGTRVATIDSVGSQANRMEPVFKDPPFDALVPQITIAYGNQRTVTIFDAGHRLGDALIRSVAADEASDFDLRQAAEDAFMALLERRDAGEIAKLAPTSLVFGAWDSRGSQAKLPRIVQSIIRAWDVDELHRSAQYNPPIDYAEADVFTDVEKEKQAGNPKSPLAIRGFVHVPAGRTHGGVVARGPIERQLTVNLVALRRLKGDNTQALRRYVLGLSLVAATAPLENFLRQGCMLVPDPDAPAEWTLVDRTGNRNLIGLTAEQALDYAEASARAFGVGPSHRLELSKDRARQDAKKSDKKAAAAG